MGTPVSGRVQGRLGRAPALLLNVRPDGTRNPVVSGQALVWTRAGAGGNIADTLGRVRPTVHSQPKYEAVDLDGDGIRETLGILMEPARTNNFGNTEDFGNAAWAKTRCSVSADATTAPNGTLTADKLVEDATASNSHLIQRATPTLTASTYSSFSVFLKAAGRTMAVIAMVRKDGTSVGVWYNLATGVLGSVGSNARGRMTAYGNGWYRCQAAFDSLTGATAPSISFGPATTDASLSYSGDGASGLYVWGAQFETDKPIASSYEGVSAKVADAPNVTVAWPQQDFTVYAKLVRGWWADLGVAGDVYVAFRLGTSTHYMDLYGYTASVYAEVSNGVTQSTSQSMPAGATMEWCAQVRNLATAAQVRLDVGAGFGAYSTALVGATTPNSTVNIGNNTGVSQLHTPLLALKVAAGALTMDQMRGAF
jgi:hypothetical protein